MPKVIRHKVWAVWMTVCMAVPAWAQPVDSMQGYATLGDELTDFYNQLSDVGADMPSVAEAPALPASLAVPADVSLPSVLAAQGDMPAAQISALDLRVALLQLAFAVGSNDQIALVQAQQAQMDAAPMVISVQGGSVDLTTLKAWVAAQPELAEVFDGDTLRMPIVVFQDARLHLTAGDQLRLSRENGAFIVNLGQLVIDGATIQGTTEPNARSESFVPFVSTVGTGMAQVSDSLITDLGFGSTIAFAGFSVVNRGLYAAIGPSYLVDSVLRDVQSAGFDSTQDAVVARNMFVGDAAGSLEMRGINGGQIVGNVFAANETGGALMVTDESTGATVSHNLVLGSASTGIIVNKGSDNIVTAKNTVWNSQGGGITIADSNCAYVSENVTIDNRRKGIELRSSQTATVTHNAIFGNGSAGLAISDQPQDADTIVRANVFVGNRIGLSSASANRVHLHGNDFSDQFPRFLDGDFAADSHAIVSDLRGVQSISLTAGGIPSFTAAPETCTYKVEG